MTNLAPAPTSGPSSSRAHAPGHGSPYEAGSRGARRHRGGRRHRLCPAGRAIVDRRSRSSTTRLEDRRGVAGAQGSAGAAHTLSGYLDRSELDPERLREIDERLSAWVGLARRHRRPPAELPALLAQWQAELREIEAAADLDALQAAHDAARSAYDVEAKRISSARKAAAPKFAAAVTRTMQQLGMAGGRFDVALEPTGRRRSFGLEAVEFLVAGQPARRRDPWAGGSGGELSRIALAVAVVGTSCRAAASRPDGSSTRSMPHRRGRSPRRSGG